MSLQAKFWVGLVGMVGNRTSIDAPWKSTFVQKCICASSAPLERFDACHVMIIQTDIPWLSAGPCEQVNLSWGTILTRTWPKNSRSLSALSSANVLPRVIPDWLWILCEVYASVAVCLVPWPGSKRRQLVAASAALAAVFVVFSIYLSVFIGRVDDGGGHDDSGSPPLDDTDDGSTSGVYTNPPNGKSSL